MQTEILSGGSGIKIGFKDPWYADGMELGGIKQNCGANAIWHDYDQLNIVVDNDDAYKGIFKGLDPIYFDYYYSVRAPVDPILQYHNQQITFNGRDLARHLTASRPEMKVLYVSGYTDDAIVHHGILDRDVHFLQKPFNTEELLQRVRRVLDE